jgi:thioredoxin reductase (NADPH)
MTELDKDEQFYRDTESIAFPKLDDRQLAMLEPLGAASSCSKRASVMSG